MFSFITRRLDQRVWGELARHRRLIIYGLICSALASALAALYIKETSNVVKALDEIAKHVGMPNRPEDMNNLLASLGMITFAFILRYFFTKGQFYWLGVASNRLTADLRKRVFRKMLRLPVSYFNDRRSGEIQSILTNDINVFSGSIGMLRDSIDGPLKILVGSISIIFLEWRLAMVAVLIFPIIAFAIQRNARKMKIAQKEVQDELATMTATMQEAISGVRVVKAFSAENRIINTVDQSVERSYESTAKTVRLVANLRPLVELLGAVCLVIVFYLCGVIRIPFSNIVPFALALDYINQGARSLGNLNQTMAQITAASDRVYSELLEVEETVSDAPNAKVVDNPAGRIEFQNVSFQYPDGTQALSNVSFVLEPGTSLALVGPSGAGKSTIADLLLRFYDPTEGRILYDGTDIRELNGDWYRSQIGVVPQQTFLFAGTIGDNLRLGLEDASTEDVERAATAANAHGFIMSAELGYETVLGERGIRISGGEGQRLAIARALIRDPKVLLLDEATSNLDGHSERIVTAALEHAMERRTTLFIAHRLTTAARATKIVMLKSGEILEEGSHDDLIARNGPYASMYRAFSSGFLEEAAIG
jgi:subfamily B ATP-binding cassette protein MsbA